jgi:beta-ureidopropionase
VRIALVQQAVTADVDANRARGIAAARRAAERGAALVAFPELAFTPFYPRRRVYGPPPLELAEPIPGPTTDLFSTLARELRIVVVLNLYERDGNLAFDSSPVIDTDGAILGVTRMLHIAQMPGFHEQGYYTPGDRGMPVFATAAGRIGVAICYDRHYPEVMRSLGLHAAEVVVIPQAGTVGEWPEGLYEAEMRVAAFQNGYFTALANRVGREGALEFAGESFVCDPTGRVIARAGLGVDELLVCDLDVATILASHAKRFFLRDRRPELVASLLAPMAVDPDRDR